MTLSVKVRKVHVNIKNIRQEFWHNSYSGMKVYSFLPNLERIKRWHQQPAQARNPTSWGISGQGRRLAVAWPLGTNSGLKYPTYSWTARTGLRHLTLVAHTELTLQAMIQSEPICSCLRGLRGRCTNWPGPQPSSCYWRSTKWAMLFLSSLQIEENSLLWIIVHLWKHLLCWKDRNNKLFPLRLQSSAARRNQYHSTVIGPED